MKKLFVLAVVIVSFVFVSGFGERPVVSVEQFAALKKQVSEQDRIIAGQKAAIVRQNDMIVRQTMAIKALEDQTAESMSEAIEARFLAEDHEIIIEQVRAAVERE